MVRTSLLMHLGTAGATASEGGCGSSRGSRSRNSRRSPIILKHHNSTISSRPTKTLLTWLPAGDTSLRIRRRARGAHPLDRQPARQIRNSRERHERRLRRGGTVSVGGRKGRRHPFVLLADSLTRVGGRHRRVQVRVSFSLLQKNIHNDERNKTRLKRTGGKSHPLLPYKKWGLAVLLRFRSTRLFCISLYTS
jgi:hypothetical protein